MFLDLLKFSSFTIENEKEIRMSFLDINIICEQGKFATFTYPKPTFVDFILILTVFCHPPKIFMIHTLLYRFYQICSDWTKFRLELVKLTDVSKNNGYPENFINNFVKHIF